MEASTKPPSPNWLEPPPAQFFSSATPTKAAPTPEHLISSPLAAGRAMLYATDTADEASRGSASPTKRPPRPKSAADKSIRMTVGGIDTIGGNAEEPPDDAAGDAPKPVYVGELDSFGRPHGRGSYYYEDGGLYVGEFAKGVPDGVGKESLVAADGTPVGSYAGSFRGGRWEGQGVRVFRDGKVYEGQFRRNKCDGAGTLFSRSGGELYKGSWSAGERIGGRDSRESTSWDEPEPAASPAFRQSSQGKLYLSPAAVDALMRSPTTKSMQKLRASAIGAAWGTASEDKHSADNHRRSSLVDGNLSKSFVSRAADEAAAEQFLNT